MSSKLTSPQFNNYPPTSFMNRYSDVILFAIKERKECINYLHMPYCNRRCGYCILSSVVRDTEKLDKEIDFIMKEIDMYSQHTTDREIVAALWGGGTPSLLSADQVHRVYGHAREKMAFSPNAEITVEMKPDTVTKENLDAFINCGVNRLSFGVQTLNEMELKYCNRENTPKIIFDAIDLATKSGLTNMNFDLMIGLPSQTLETFRETCETIFGSLQPNCCSLYILIVHPKTSFSTLLQNKPELFPHNEEIIRMYYTFFEVAEKHGYVATSTLNVARKPSLKSKYQYYNWLGYERIAIGPEAIGYIGQTQYINYSWRNEEYGEFLKKNKFPIRIGYTLTTEQIIRRWIILGLQNLSIDINVINAAYGINVLNDYREVWGKLKLNNFIKIEGSQINLTHLGKRHLYAIQTMFYEEHVDVAQKGVAGVIIKESDHQVDTVVA